MTTNVVNRTVDGSYWIKFWAYFIKLDEMYPIVIVALQWNSTFFLFFFTKVRGSGPGVWGDTEGIRVRFNKRDPHGKDIRGNAHGFSPKLPKIWVK